MEQVLLTKLCANDKLRIEAGGELHRAFMLTAMQADRVGQPLQLTFGAAKKSAMPIV